MSARTEINSLFLDPLGAALASGGDAATRATVGSTFAASMQALRADDAKFGRVFCRQTHAQTRERVDALLNSIAADAPNVTGAMKAASPRRPITNTQAAKVTEPDMASLMLDKAAREKALELALTADERAELRRTDAPAAAAAADAAAEPVRVDELSDFENDDDANSLFDSDDSESGAEDREEAEYDAEVDGPPADQDDEFEAGDGGEQDGDEEEEEDEVPREMERAANASEDDDEAVFERALKKARSPVKRKAKTTAGARQQMSAVAREVKKAQAESKRKRKEAYGSEASSRAVTDMLGSIVEVAATNLYQRQAAALSGQPVVQTFERLVLTDTSDDERIKRLAHALTQLRHEIAATTDLARRAKPTELEVLCDFVGGAESVCALSDANAAGASSCAVLRRRVAPSALTAYEALRDRPDGTHKPVKMVALTSLAPLIEALWFLENLMPIAEERVRARLLKMRGFSNGKTTYGKMIELLAADDTASSVSRYLFKTLRKSLDRVDMSVAMLSARPPEPDADEDAIDED